MHRIVIHYGSSVEEFHFYRINNDEGDLEQFHPKPARKDCWSLEDAIDFAYRRAHVDDCEYVLLTFGGSTVRIQEVSDQKKTARTVDRVLEAVREEL